MPIHLINNQPVDFRISLPSDSECKSTSGCSGGDICQPYNKLDDLIFQFKHTPCTLVELLCDPTLTNNNANLVTNGDFNAAGTWTYGTGWSYDSVNKRASLLASGTGTLYQALSIIPTLRYEVSFDITSTTGTGAVSVDLGGTAIGSFTATGSYKFTVAAGSANNRINFVGSGASVSPRTIYIDNVVVKTALVGDNDIYCVYSGSPDYWIQQQENTLTHLAGNTNSLYTNVYLTSYTGYWLVKINVTGYTGGSCNVIITDTMTPTTLGTIDGNGEYTFYYNFNAVTNPYLILELAPDIDFAATITGWNAYDYTLNCPIGLVNVDTGYAITLNDYVSYDGEYITVKYNLPSSLPSGTYQVCIYEFCTLTRDRDLINDFDFENCDLDYNSPDDCNFGVFTFNSTGTGDNIRWFRPYWDTNFNTFEAGIFKFTFETGIVDYPDIEIQLYNIGTNKVVCTLLTGPDSNTIYTGLVNIVHDASAWDIVVRIVVPGSVAAGSLMELKSFQLNQQAFYPNDGSKICSNCLDIATSHRCSQWVAGNCDQEAFGFSFKNGFKIAGRVRSMFINPKYKGELQRYADAGGTFTVTKAASNKIYIFLIDYVPERTHDWMRLALLCDEIAIGTNPTTTSLWVNTDGDYQPEWPDTLGNFQFAQCRVELQAKTDELFNNNAG